MNSKKTIAALLLIGSIILLLAFYPPDDPLNRIAAKLYQWISQRPQEKVYLQLDKPFYAIGDDIWLKAYVTTGSKHQLSLISGVLNVELIDDQDSVRQSLKLPVVSGLCWGNFTLTDSLKEGNYRIRAYTNWMRNEGSDYFFDEPIRIVNAITNNVFTHTNYQYNNENGVQKIVAAITYTNLSGMAYANKPVTYQVQLNSKAVSRGKGITDKNGVLNVGVVNTLTTGFAQGKIISEIKLNEKETVQKSILIKAMAALVDVQFFPEGGNLVYGNDTKLAFKAIAADGLGAEVKGVIIDDEHKEVATFASTHLGMGILMLRPVSGRTYAARISYADGSTGSVALPVPANAGYSFSISNQDEANISIKIVGGAVVSAGTSQTDVMSVIGQSGGTIYYAAKSKPGSKLFMAVVPKSKFQTGIVQFTLFNSKGEPLNERLVFINNHDELKLDAVAEKDVYATREKVKIALAANSAAGKPAVGSFSVAVTDETKVPPNEVADNTIMSNLLLTSDLRGYVEQPGYYFTNENEKTAADLDVLLLTQGYHRFEWKQVLSDNPPPVKYEAEKTLQITGYLKTPGGKPVVGGKVSLLYTKGSFFMLDTVTDKAGRFTFNNLMFKDSIKFIIQARTAKNRKDVEINLDNMAPLQTGNSKANAGFEVNISNGLTFFLQNSKTFYDEQLKFGVGNRAIQLKEVVIKDRKAQPLNNSANLNGPGNADQVIKPDELANLPCGILVDCLQGRMLGVVFRNGIPYSTRSPGTPMTIVLDGSYITADLLDDLNANDIGSIEVLRSINYTGIYGGNGAGGVLVITTKRGDGNYNYQRYAPGIVTYMPKGYVKVKTFYSPQYDKPETNTQIPDLRSTIYWNPNIITDKDGKAAITYFNADGKGTYRVVIEGIDADGNLGRKVYRYKVE